MRQLGSTLLLFGGGSALLSFTNMEFVILMWVDMWGPAIGWMIRGAMIVLGLLFFGLSFVVNKQE